MIRILGEVVAILLVVVPLLIGVAFFTIAERKGRSSIQRRRGPNVVGFLGLTQPFADGLKLLVKETVRPSAAHSVRFVAAPRVTFTLSLVGWAVIPLGPQRVFADVNLGALYLFAVSSLAVYGVIRAGWSSNSKYAFLGALRSAAQRVSYEVSRGFLRVCVLLCAKSRNLTEIVEAQRARWYCVPLLPAFLRFSVTILAETNRHPFDLPEAEAELVSGYNVEYSGRGFALFFLGEYGSRILRSCLIVLLFLGGWLLPGADTGVGRWLASVIPAPAVRAVKVLLFVYFFIAARAAYPRYRYDQLRRLGWQVFLPVSLGRVLLTAAEVYWVEPVVGLLVPATEGDLVSLGA